MATLHPFPHATSLPPNRATWLPVVCPVCHMLARAVPDGREIMAIGCESCGEYRLSWAAQKVFEAQPGSTDRDQLSEALQDACLMAECDWPLIDGLTAAALVGMATLPAPAHRQARSVGRGVAAL